MFKINNKINLKTSTKKLLYRNTFVDEFRLNPELTKNYKFHDDV